MSFLKSLILAILATVFLTYVLGSSLIGLLDIDIYMENQLIEPLKAISLSALVIVFLVVAVLAIVLSVFGSVIFLGLIGAGAVVMFAVGVFWPILFIAVVIWAMTRDNKNNEEAY